MREMRGFFNLQRTVDSANEFIFSSEDLKRFTFDFNEKNLIGVTQLGKLYRGQIQLYQSTATDVRNVTVKIWDRKQECAILTTDECLIREEVNLSTHPYLKGHPSFAKLIGYCCENEVKGVVYDLYPLDSLENLMAKDDLNWLQRVDVILELARLINFMHSQGSQNLAFNFRASNILLDWECKPKLCGFGRPSNGNLNKSYNRGHIPSGCFDLSLKGGRHWEMSSDVFAFGEILLGLIAKRDSETEKLENQDHHMVVDSRVNIWAKNEYRPNTSLVHKTLQEDWGYSAEEGIQITEIAMQCIQFFPSNRPSMKQVVQHLEGLPVAQRLSDVRPRKKERKFLSNAMGM